MNIKGIMEGQRYEHRITVKQLYNFLIARVSSPREFSNGMKRVRGGIRFHRMIGGDTIGRHVP